jgi:ABC-type lipoprotein release transport system permease subunit
MINQFAAQQQNALNNLQWKANYGQAVQPTISAGSTLSYDNLMQTAKALGIIPDEESKLEKRVSDIFKEFYRFVADGKDGLTRNVEKALNYAH